MKSNENLQVNPTYIHYIAVNIQCFLDIFYGFCLLLHNNLGDWVVIRSGYPKTLRYL
jgi:hypothetical protein